MDDGKHTTDDNSFMTSVVRHIGAGVALVLVVAGAFWGIGQIQGPEAGDPVISAPASVADTETVPPPADTPTDIETTPTVTFEETPTEAEPPTSPSDEIEETPSEEPSPFETAETGDFEPADISVQVLDAAGDGGDRANTATAALSEDGYPVVAQNQAVRTYERSTLFYTAGHEDEARYIASQHPEFGVIDEKPDNLSDSVDVHVIVGADYPAG